MAQGDLPISRVYIPSWWLTVAGGPVVRRVQQTAGPLGRDKNENNTHALCNWKIYPDGVVR